MSLLMPLLPSVHFSRTDSEGKDVGSKKRKMAGRAGKKTGGKRKGGDRGGARKGGDSRSQGRKAAGPRRTGNKKRQTF